MANIGKKITNKIFAYLKILIFVLIVSKSLNKCDNDKFVDFIHTGCTTARLREVGRLCMTTTGLRSQDIKVI